MVSYSKKYFCRLIHDNYDFYNFARCFDVVLKLVFVLFIWARDISSTRRRMAVPFRPLAGVWLSAIACQHQCNVYFSFGRKWILWSAAAKIIKFEDMLYYLAIIHSKVQAYPMVLCYDGKPLTSRKMLVVKTVLRQTYQMVTSQYHNHCLRRDQNLPILTNIL